MWRVYGTTKQSQFVPSLGSQLKDADERAAHEVRSTHGRGRICDLHIDERMADHEVELVLVGRATPNEGGKLLISQVLEGPVPLNASLAPECLRWLVALSFAPISPSSRRDPTRMEGGSGPRIDYHKKVETIIALASTEGATQSFLPSLPSLHPLSYKQSEVLPSFLLFNCSRSPG